MKGRLAIPVAVGATLMLASCTDDGTAAPEVADPVAATAPSRPAEKAVVVNLRH